MSEKEKTVAVQGFDAFVSGAVIFVITVVVHGAAAKLMWRWFIVPLGETPIGLAHAVGLVTLARFVLGGKGDRDKPLLEVAAMALVYAALCLLVAFIASACM